MRDTYRHKGMRKQLVEALRRQGIKDEKVLSAIGLIPRHFFLDKAFEEMAYENKAFPIGNEQTISQPFTVAYQTELLKVQRGDRILEIGTGSGYQATVLAALGATVFTIERQEDLYLKTRSLLKKLQIKQVYTFLGDGAIGLKSFAPFDGILITAGAKSIPAPLVEQLRINRNMVIPVGDQSQNMILLTKTSPETYHLEEKGEFRFVPFERGIVKAK